MKEIFDINLLSQIKGLDKKLSISKEQLKLKNQVQVAQKHKGQQRENKQETSKEEDKTKERVKKIVDEEGHIDITA